ncbi:MAG: hypothetical protein RLZZ396_5 [Planctomycetota bacterium]
MRPVPPKVRVRFNVWINHPSNGPRLVAQGLKAKRAMRLAAELLSKHPESDFQIVPVSAIVFDKPKVLRVLGGRIDSRLVC